MEKKREGFKSNIGFILACIGSAVGMGNIWLFPYRAGEFGGAAFLIPYIFFVALLGISGMAGEMAFGRSMKSGPYGAFVKSFRQRNIKGGKIIGCIPVVGSFGIAIGYSVVVGWFIKYLIASCSGVLMNITNIEAYFEKISAPLKNIPFHILGMVITFIIMALGVSKGIEQVNKYLMPCFYGIFFLLMIYVAFLPGSVRGYKYLFVPRWDSLKNVKTWVYALGQAFFSLSIGGSGTVVYGSYLKDNVDVIKCAKKVALFDTLAAVLASVVIIPAIFSFQGNVTSGPALMFISLPSVFQKMPFGRIIAIVLFLAVLVAAITSLINLFEPPIETMQSNFGLSRKNSVLIIAFVAIPISILIEDVNIVGLWMDFVSIYIIPLGALLAAITFFWICPKNFARREIQKGRMKTIGPWFEFITKYWFVFTIFLVYILGIFYGGIG